LQLGFLNWFFFIVFLVIGVFGIAYFLVLPWYAFKKLTGTWKLRSRIILFLSYFVLFSVSGIVFWVLPGYYLQTYYIDLPRYAQFHVFEPVAILYRISSIMFFTLPLIYIGIVGFARLILHRKQITFPSN
jgi:uncharacterized membrane protein